MGTGLTVKNIYLTFYAYDDNDDGNGNYGNAIISDPVIHTKATEDLGTYDKPSTFATDYKIATPGSIIYVPKLRKYYIMEDTCVECTDDVQKGLMRIDLYIGGNTALQGNSVADCESMMTSSPYSDTVVFNPSSNWPVSLPLLFSNGMCPGIIWSF